MALPAARRVPSRFHASEDTEPLLARWNVVTGRRSRSSTRMLPPGAAYAMVPSPWPATRRFAPANAMLRIGDNGLPTSLFDLVQPAVSSTVMTPAR